jgi:HIRAN domain
VTLVLSRIPVVAGIAYMERVQRLPSSLSVTLTLEPGNRYFPQAIAVVANGDKIGYVAPEVARAYYERIAAASPPVTCTARRASLSDHESSGVELLLDFRELG